MIEFTNYSNFGAAILKARKDQGLTMTSVIKKTGLTLGQIAAIETGSKPYEVSDLLIYLNVLGLTLAAIDPLMI